MGKPVKAYEVTNLSKVDVTKYKDGDIFITNRGVGLLVNGVMRTLTINTPNLRNYVKKSDVRKIIKEEIEKIDKHE